MTGTDDEFELFRQAMADVRPIETPQTRVERPRPAPIPVQKQRNEEEVIREMASGRFDPGIHELGSELVFLRDGYQERVLKKLRRAQIAVEGHLDLHGMGTREARQSVQNFLVEAVKRRVGCVRIVHGKGLRSPGGEPVLKPQLADWLRKSDAVVAFCSAPPTDGGTGALYVALRPPRR